MERNIPRRARCPRAEVPGANRDHATTVSGTGTRIPTSVSGTTEGPCVGHTLRGRSGLAAAGRCDRNRRRIRGGGGGSRCQTDLGNRGRVPGSSAGASRISPADEPPTPPPGDARGRRVRRTRIGGSARRVSPHRAAQTAAAPQGFTTACRSGAPTNRPFAPKCTVPVLRKNECSDRELSRPSTCHSLRQTLYQNYSTCWRFGFGSERGFWRWTRC